MVNFLLMMIERISSYYIKLPNKHPEEDEVRDASHYERFSFVFMFVFDELTSLFGILLLFPDVISVMQFFKVVYFPENLD